MKALTAEEMDNLIENLDGEAVVVDQYGSICFDHGIYMNGRCLQCGGEMHNQQANRPGRE